WRDVIVKYLSPTACDQDNVISQVKRSMSCAEARRLRVDPAHYFRALLTSNPVVLSLAVYVTFCRLPAGLAHAANIVAYRPERVGFWVRELQVDSRAKLLLSVRATRAAPSSGLRLTRQ